MKLKSFALAVFTILFVEAGAQEVYTGNPIINHVEAADPQVVFVNNKYYIYPTDNTKKEPGFDVWSSNDLKEWTNEGEILNFKDVPFAHSRAWAPALVERNGKYYYYFSANDQIGVAENDSPVGTFKEALGEPLIPYQADLSTIDPMVFIDDDGQAYLYWGAVPGTWRRDSADVIYYSLFVQKLADDMMTRVGPIGFTVRATDDHYEGTHVFKRNGTYYLMYSAGNYNAPATDPHAYRVEYATASSPMGPFTKADNNPILRSVDSMKIASPGHNSVLEIPGTDDRYIVYHSHKGEVKRKTFINKLEFDEKGQIKKINPDYRGVKPRPIKAHLLLDEKGPYKEGQAIAMTVVPQGKKEKIKMVTIYSGTKVIAQLTKAPFRFEWKDAAPGFHKVFAEISYASGEKATSSIWSFDVK